MKLKKIRPIEPKKSRCISVDSNQKLFVAGESTSLLTHNSVAQQNIILSCLLRPEHWVIIGIDLKRVELKRYNKYGMSTATELNVAVDYLRFAQAVMMKRYERLEELGLNNFLDLPVPGQALLVLIDEAGELLSPDGGKSDEAKEKDALKEEAKAIIGSIARLGRAAGVHLVVATQRPDATLIPGETKANLAVRLGCGRLQTSASQMLFGSNVGARTPSNPPGGIYIQIHGENGNRGQGFFATDDWIEEYYEKHPDERPVINPDGTISRGGDFDEIPSGESLETVKFDPMAEWDEDMDEIINSD